MVTHLSHKSFQQNMFLSIGTIYILFVICFSLYHFRRERDYRIDILHSNLQAYNHELSHLLVNGSIDTAKVNAFMTQKPIEDIRITVIDKAGRVLFDSQENNTTRIRSHTNRQEIREAWKKGSGYDIKRLSETTNETYFYSATKIKDVIIRSAIPYSTQLTLSLHIDYSYVIYVVILSLLLFVVIYQNTSRVSKHIRYLRDFAYKASHGQALDHELERKLPDDELGEISHTITTLYWKLRHSEEEKERIKRQLTQNATHELKTPVASIHGYLETIIGHPEMSEERRQHFLQRCFAQSERMAHLLSDMAILTKLDETDASKPAETNLSAEEIDIATLVDNVLDDTSLLIHKHNIKTTIDIPSETKVWGDSQLLYSIFRNLIDNILAYATGTTEISISATKTTQQNTEQAFTDEKEETPQDGVGEEYYLFKVSDNGCGVEPQHLGKLFERFYRTDKGRSRKLGGTGLGLAIVKNAIIAHGGTCHAEMTPGGGLTICFTLKVGSESVTCKA